MENLKSLLEKTVWGLSRYAVMGMEDKAEGMTKMPK